VSVPRQIGEGFLVCHMALVFLGVHSLNQAIGWRCDCDPSFQNCIEVIICWNPTFNLMRLSLKGYRVYICESCFL